MGTKHIWTGWDYKHCKHFFARAGFGASNHIMVNRCSWRVAFAGNHHNRNTLWMGPKYLRTGWQFYITKLDIVTGSGTCTRCALFMATGIHQQPGTAHACHQIRWNALGLGPKHFGPSWHKLSYNSVKSCAGIGSSRSKLACRGSWSYAFSGDYHNRNTLRLGPQHIWPGRHKLSHNSVESCVGIGSSRSKLACRDSRSYAFTCHHHNRNTLWMGPQHVWTGGQ